MKRPQSRNVRTKWTGGNRKAESEQKSGQIQKEKKKNTSFLKSNLEDFSRGIDPEDNTVWNIGEKSEKRKQNRMTNLKALERIVEYISIYFYV